MSAEPEIEQPGQDVVDEFVDLVDRHGLNDPAVRDFRASHEREDPSLKADFDMVEDLYRRGDVNAWQRLVARVLWATCVLVAGGLVVLGIQSRIELTQTSDSLVAANKKMDQALVQAQAFQGKFQDEEAQSAKLKEVLHKKDALLDDQRVKLKAVNADLDKTRKLLSDAERLALVTQKKSEAAESKLTALTESYHIKESALKKNLKDVQESADKEKRELFTALERERKRRDSDSHWTSTIVMCSRWRNQSLPFAATKGIQKMIARVPDDAKGGHYLKAMWFDMTKDDIKYRREIDWVDDAWFPIARAEIQGVDGDLKPLVKLLGQLEGKIRSDPDPVDLTFYLNQKTVSQQVAVRLQAKGKPVVEELVKGMEDREAITAMVATIGEIGPEAKDAVSPLIQVMKKGNAGDRWEAIHALGKMGLAASMAADDLRASARYDKDESVRRAAESSLKLVAPR